MWISDTSGHGHGDNNGDNSGDNSGDKSGDKSGEKWLKTKVIEFSRGCSLRDNRFRIIIRSRQLLPDEWMHKFQPQLQK